MTKTEEIVTKVSRDFQKLNQLVRGNGTIEGSVLGRLKVLEERDEKILEKLDIITNKPCREPCIFEAWQEKDDKMKEKRRAFRSADIANWIAVAGLAYLIIAGLL